MDPRCLSHLEFPKLLGRLSRLAASEAGARACLEIAPLADPAELARRQEILRQALDCAPVKGLAVGSFPPLDGVFVFLGQARASLDADGLWAVREALDTAKALRDAFADEESTALWPLLSEMVLAGGWPARLHPALKRCLGRDGGLRDESSPELFAVRQEIRRIHQRCTSQVKDFVTKQGLSSYLQDDFMTISSDRYVLPLKTNFKGRLHGIIHDYSQTGETCYFEPMFLVEVNNRLQELKREEREEELKVLAYLTGLARAEEGELRRAYALAVDMDALLAQVKLAGLFDGQVPEVGPDAPVELIGARHPLLALAEGGKARPVDVVLKPGQRALIISGANAAGKTVCLKTLGLCALMALSGLPVPVREGSRLPFWDEIFVFMGDEQSLEDHLSTFTAQISQLSRAWPRLGGTSLVVLDEFGAGTDPAQGAALAQAVVDKMLDRGVYVAAATHFPALKAYGLAREGVRSASMLFDPKTKKPLYVLAYDQVGASVALDVARDCGLAEEILEQAQKYLLMEGADTAKLFDRLNELALAREREVDELARQRGKLEQKRKHLAEVFERDRTRLLTELRAKAQELLRAVQAEKIGRKQALKELAETRRAAESLGEKPGGAEGESASIGGPGLVWETLAEGTRVRLSGWDRPGVVRDKDEKRRQVKVDMGGVSLWAGFDDLLPDAVGAQSRPVAPPKLQEPAKPVLGPVLTLDLRGLRADAAVSELAGFLDRAILRGASQVEVVHGRGTGALRREVHAFLKDSPVVEGYCLATEEHGGDGMTVVDIK